VNRSLNRNAAQPPQLSTAQLSTAQLSTAQLSTAQLSTAQQPPKRRKRVKAPGRMALHAKTYIGFFLAFLYLPIFVLIAYSFNESKSRLYFTGFTLSWYKQLFSNSLIASSLRATLVIAVVSSLAATALGTAAAIGISNMRKWARATVMNLTYLPIINPEIVTGVSMMLLFGGFQVFFAWLGDTFGVQVGFEFGYMTLILAHITFCTPYVILNVMPKLRQMDKNVDEAALDLGCNDWQALTKVVVPDIMPGIIAGFLTSLTMSLDDFVISYFVSGPTSQTLPITIFSMTRRKVSPEINALSTILFIIVLTVLAVINIQEGRRERLKARQQHAAKRMAALLAILLGMGFASAARHQAPAAYAAPAAPMDVYSAEGAEGAEGASSYIIVATYEGDAPAAGSIAEASDIDAGTGYITEASDLDTEAGMTSIRLPFSLGTISPVGAAMLAAVGTAVFAVLIIGVYNSRKIRGSSRA
jgi:spermidine/putrescine transport system permease protein